MKFSDSVLLLVFLCGCFNSRGQISYFNDSPFGLELVKVKQDSLFNVTYDSAFRFGGVIFEKEKLVFKVSLNTHKQPPFSKYYLTILEIYPDNSLQIVAPNPMNEDLNNYEDFFLSAQRGAGFITSVLEYFPPYGNYKDILILSPYKELSFAIFNSFDSVPQGRGSGLRSTPEKLLQEITRVLKGVPSPLFKDCYFATIDFNLLPPKKDGSTSLAVVPDKRDQASLPSNSFAFHSITDSFWQIQKNQFLWDPVKPVYSLEVECKNKLYSEPEKLHVVYPMLSFINPHPQAEDYSRGARLAKSNTSSSYVIQGNANAAKGIKSIIVNGEPANMQKLTEVQYYWEKEVTLKKGENHFTITAVSNENAENCETVNIMFEPSQENLVAKGKNYLLLIGINEYQQWNKLTGAAHDVADLKKELETHFDFASDNVSELLNANATKDNIDSVFSLLASRLTEADNLLVYYAGHGVLDPQIKDQGYWIPVEARKGKRTDYIPNEYIKGFMQSFKARHVLIIADACFSGAFFKSSRGDNAYGDKVSQLQSRWVFCSGREEEVDDVMKGKSNSPFAFYLLESLKGLKNGEHVSIKELSLEVSKQVAANSHQTPVAGPIRETGDAGGEFVFERKN